MTLISLFKSDAGDVFFDRPVKSLVEELYKAADETLDTEIVYNLPDNAGICKRVAHVVIERVEDNNPYFVQAVSKPQVNRAPEGEPGSSVVQSLVFDKEVFESADACREWISKNEGFGDYGMDETENTYRFRQYDPEHFEKFATKDLTEGVIAVIGIIKGAVEVEDEEEPKEETSKAPEDVRALNAKIHEHGLLVLPGSAEVRKEDSEEEGEERYVLSLVMEPNDGQDGAPFKPDTQGDIQSAKEIRKTAHRWMEHYGLIDLMHSWQSVTKDDVRVLESYLAPCDFSLGEDGKEYTIVKGSWLLGIRVINDEIWKAVKSGELGAYSIGGTAVRTPVGEEASDGEEEA